MRLGNRVEEGDRSPGSTQFNSEIQKWTGLFDAAPVRLEYCAKTQAQSEPVCQIQNDLSKIPLLISSVITRPVGFILLDPQNGDGLLVNRDFDLAYDSGIPVALAPESGALSALATTLNNALFLDPDCQYHYRVSGTGNLHLETTPEIDGYPTKGRYTMDWTSTLELEGVTCSSTLIKMQACLQELMDCGGADITENQILQSQAQKYFDPYLTAGVLSAAEVGDMATVFYKISY